MNVHSAVNGVEELVSILTGHGVGHAVISPGSRNAPLSIAMSNRAGLKTFVVADERSAGYFALGMSWALKKPVVLVCTSGTASLNYHPAIAEAFYRNIPLIVITADRPEEWIDQGDGQTIRQQGIFSNHIKFEATLPSINDIDTQWHFNRLVNDAVLAGQHYPKGPVHLNFPLREPLYKRTNTLPAEVRVVKQIHSFPFPAEESINELKKLVEKSAKTLILCGQQYPNENLNRVLTSFSSSSSVFVLTETTSNLDLPFSSSSIDRLIDGFTETDKTDFAPDFLITLNGAVVSKKVKAWLRKATVPVHLHIGEAQTMPDTYQHLTHWIHAEPEFILAALAEAKNDTSVYQQQWMNLSTKKEKNHDAFADSCEWSDFSMYRDFLPTIPEGTLLHLANSTPIRYSQLFGATKGVIYDSNRGTSGIDGCVSTAAGAAAFHNGMTCVISGDIGFQYDSNALWNNYLSEKLRILLVNNKGGNIFRIIDGPEDDTEMKTYFETFQETNVQALCTQFNIQYLSASNDSELSDRLEIFWHPTDRPVLLEVFTDNKISPAVLKLYFNALKN
ncbi:MAG: 2-succinyl-5-enolpyruvyl-6-hydroxy-3-cyclohexene-1-carboxylic-acid synthase [Flavobacteriales bacterium]